MEIFITCAECRRRTIFRVAASEMKHFHLKTHPPVNRLRIHSQDERLSSKNASGQNYGQSTFHAAKMTLYCFYMQITDRWGLWMHGGWHLRNGEDHPLRLVCGTILKRQCTVDSRLWRQQTALIELCFFCIRIWFFYFFLLLANKKTFYIVLWHNISCGLVSMNDGSFLKHKW